ncbi:hypothetical protein FRC02_009782 [Tulasnella sp. 418]|nr:hypothetical protein FRC02_009782 [Tulasnella sp. 418]
MLPERWTYREEVYNFQSDPRKNNATVVLTVEQDNDDYAKQQGSPHPIAWYQERLGGADADATLVGRSFYSSLGHMNSTWKDPLFLGHIFGGVTWIMDGNTTLAYNNQAKVGNAAGFGAPKKRPTSTTSALPGPTASADGNTTNNNNTQNAAQTLVPAWSAAFLVFVASLLFIHGF